MYDTMNASITVETFIHSYKMSDLPGPNQLVFYTSNKIFFCKKNYQCQCIDRNTAIITSTAINKTTRTLQKVNILKFESEVNVTLLTSEISSWLATPNHRYSKSQYTALRIHTLWRHHSALRYAFSNVSEAIW